MGRLSFEEKIFREFTKIREAGKKITKETLDEIDPELYLKSVRHFGSWREAKRKYMEYLALQKNPMLEVKEQVAQKILELSNKFNMSILKDGELNKDFEEKVKQEDSFIYNMVMFSFNNWDNMVEYMKENNIIVEEKVSEEQIINEVKNLIINAIDIKEEELLNTNKTIYNVIVNNFGSIKNFLNRAIEKVLVNL